MCTAVGIEDYSKEGGKSGPIFYLPVPLYSFYFIFPGDLFFFSIFFFLDLLAFISSFVNQREDFCVSFGNWAVELPWIFKVVAAQLVDSVFCQKEYCSYCRLFNIAALHRRCWEGKIQKLHCTSRFSPHL